MNHLETLIAEWLENIGYTVVRNIKTDKLSHGGWGSEIDIIAYHHGTNHLVHYEPSTDADKWSKRETRFTKKFSDAVTALKTKRIPQLSFLTDEQIEGIEQIAVLPSVGESHREFCGGKAVNTDEVMTDILRFVLERGQVASNALPEQFRICVRCSWPSAATTRSAAK